MEAKELKNRIRFISAVLAVIMMIGVLPFGIFAEEDNVPAYRIEITKNYYVVNNVIPVRGVTSATTVQLGTIVAHHEGNTIGTSTNPAGVTWTTSDAAVATVDSNGKVTFTGIDGSVRITATYTAENGDVISDTVVFRAKQNQYVEPSDGTDDFPEYPNAGSVRYNKTATAVGNFSQTGIAQVELSMTGVPFYADSAIDVVLILDASGSMLNYSRLKNTKAAANAFIETLFTERDKDGNLVYDEDGNIKYNENRLSVISFQEKVDTPTIKDLTDGSPSVYGGEGTFDMYSVTNTGDIAALEKCIDDNYKPTGGTPSSGATKVAEQILDAARTDGTGNNRKQFVVFMTDGAPTQFVCDGEGVECNLSRGHTSNGYDDRPEDLLSYSKMVDHILSGNNERYTSNMKKKGVTIYTVGLAIRIDDPKTIISSIASDSEKCIFVEDSNAQALNDAFVKIASDISDAAQDVVVEDKIADEYTVAFKSPAEIVTEKLPENFEFKIEYVEYTLDENHERDVENVVESVTFNAEGTKAYSNLINDGTTNILENGIITAENFTYNSNTRILTWNAPVLNETERALRYYVYLDNSADKVGSGDEVPAGTYPTNDYATLTYTNFNGNECQQLFPVPQMAWNGAQVSYVFYLVDADGNPVNKAGQPVDFANASFVTGVYTRSVVWNDLDGTSNNQLNAQYLANEILPDPAYRLYDIGAEYDLNVILSTANDGQLDADNSYFTIISGTVSNENTTKVYNTLAGLKIDDPGTYNTTCGLDLCNTTVAFAVVWEPKLVEDTIVIDYGLPVSIDVCSNDLFDNQISHISASPYSGVDINTGVSGTQQFTKNEITLKYGYVTVLGAYAVYTPTSMSRPEPEVFYYDSAVRYYEGSSENTGYMYSKVTIVPATTIYYEEGFVKFSGENGAWREVVDSVGKIPYQSQDRPTIGKMTEDLDADNLYGFDPAYENCATYSLGRAMMTTVNADPNGGAWPTATFTFTGTGFDIISLTSKDTGYIRVKVFKGTEASGTAYKSWGVDTFYGYTAVKNGYYKCVWQLRDDGNWYAEKELIEGNSNPMPESEPMPENPKSGSTFTTYEPNYTWTAATGNNALFQIPVLKGHDFPYGTYTVQITPTYASFFDHVGDKNGEFESYDFYLDAIRIYDPANMYGDGNGVIEFYKQDNEAYPQYIEIRDQLIGQNDFSISGDTTGAVFIDGFGINGDISDYTSFGPNNEVYLEPRQSIAFNFDASRVNGFDVTSVQIAAKGVNISEIGAPILAINNKNIKTLNTSTDQYYNISDMIEWTEDGKSNTVVITNNGSGILSLTTIKVTFIESEEPEAAAEALVPQPVMLFSNADTLAFAVKTLTAAPAPAEEAAPELSKSGSDVKVFTPEIAVDAVIAETVIEGIFVPEKFEVSLNKTDAKLGQTAKMTITTSSEVSSVWVNGEKATMGNTNRKTGEITWMFTVNCTSAGSLKLAVTAHDITGVSSKAITKTINVSKKGR